MEHPGALTGTLWEHLPLLVRAKSPESIEYILQALWRTRKTGLDAADRGIITEMLQLQNDHHLDPLLVCLRMLLRNCVYGNHDTDGIKGLFPSEVLPELQTLLTLLLQKFQREWREDVLKDQSSFPRLKAMTWSMSTLDEGSTEPVALIKLKLHNDVKFHSGDSELIFQMPRETLKDMLSSMQSLREELSGVGVTSTQQVP